MKRRLLLILLACIITSMCSCGNIKEGVRDIVEKRLNSSKEISVENQKEESRIENQKGNNETSVVKNQKEQMENKK